MDSIKLVEYDHSMSKKLTDMWNKSGDNWGGFDSVLTEETVINEQENSIDMHVYLAMVGEEVVGYCSLSEYREDEGSLYIPLLNVIPDYHGKKVGKTLMLKVLERTIELGWPRLDLYTWPGNTKAVPLYKKCGFFWEKRDDVTHLMNFIPAALQTEAVADYFKTAHWYDDSKRIIKIQPDGKSENDFDFFEYSWEKNDQTLRMEFEKRGRGLRLIETDDYLISARIDNQNLVFGRKYKVYYEIINKSGKFLNVSIKGRDDKNINFDFEKAVDVIDRELLEGEFYINEVEEESSIWRTQPGVPADIFINGKHAYFKLGIVPKFPAKLSLTIPDQECYRQVSLELYLDIENNFDEDAVFKFKLHGTENITLYQRSFEISLKAKEKDSIQVPYMLEDFFFFSETIPITVELKNGEVIQFTKKLGTAFKGRTGMFGGETEECWMICNGDYTVELNKRNNRRSILTYGMGEADVIVLPYPRIGKPFSAEFSKKKPYQVEYFRDYDEMVLKARYSSDDFKDIELVSVSKLYASGIVENYYEICNHSDNETPKEIFLTDNCFCRLYRSFIPYDGDIVEAGNLSYPEHWKSSKITENWIFAKGERITKGFCWSKDQHIKINEDTFFIEHAFGKLSKSEWKKTEPIYIALGTFTDWQEFRGFALGKYDNQDLSTKDGFEFLVNDGNPFVKKKFKVKIKERKNVYFNGDLILSSKTGLFESLHQSYKPTEEKQEAEFVVTLDQDTRMDGLQLDVDFSAVYFSKKAYVFKMTEDEIKKTMLEESGFEVFSVDNGVLTIKAAPSFNNSLYSLNYRMGTEHQEWLDSSFPELGPRSWFNPWIGGISGIPLDLTANSVMQEKRTGEFVEIQDNFENRWMGIKLKLKIEKHKGYQGLEFNQYFLMLPGLPILCYTVEIIQNTGSFIKDMSFRTDCFFKPDQEVQNSWFITENLSGELIKYKAGKIRHDIGTYSPLLFGSENHEIKLLMYAGDHPLPLIGFANRVDNAGFFKQNITLKNKESLFTSPMFLVYTEEYLSEELLKGLKSIKF
ncbi:MAG: GNAT family N-acetyltransferase [Halanaerobiales bacterium]|nr:GNAT family N-acetyltransferase [Halanaerobiales bacterium]